MIRVSSPAYYNRSFISNNIIVSQGKCITTKSEKIWTSLQGKITNSHHQLWFFIFFIVIFLLNKGENLCTQCTFPFSKVYGSRESSYNFKLGILVIKRKGIGLWILKRSLDVAHVDHCILNWMTGTTSSELICNSYFVKYIFLFKTSRKSLIKL